jgi:hypothetical protein
MKTKTTINLLFLACLCLLVSSVTLSDKNNFEPASTESIKRGEKIVMNYCVLCHGGEDGKLSGKMMDDIPSFFGTIHTSNITNHMEKGIGKYTKDQLRTLLRTRVKSDGKKANMLMPAFPLMADEDINGIIDFLKSDHFAVQSSEATYPPQKLKWIGRSFDKKIKIGKMPEKPILLPDTNNKNEWGKYLVTGVYRCYECHNGEMIPDDLNPTASKKYLQGGHTMYDMDKKKVKVSNITPDVATGIGSWTEEDFYKLINQGIRKNGKSVRFPMAPLPGLSRSEVNAIYSYIMSVKPIKNKIK